jgi:hypothetical protein
MSREQVATKTTQGPSKQQPKKVQVFSCDLVLIMNCNIGSETSNSHSTKEKSCQFLGITNFMVHKKRG